MLMEKTQVNRATKDILAKCMATEDLRVIHDGNAETAYFDTENRVLCLPIWEDMTNQMYDMLVGHEVSHALHTPKEGWQDFVGSGKGSRIRHMFINIVEDARIERLIKDKFPGIKRDFATAYNELHARDLFELKNRTIDINMPLIDRLNLYFKVGLFGLETIPFASEENQYITRMANTESFNDVVTLAKELYEKHLDELEDEDQDDAGSTQSSFEQGDGESGSEGSEDGQNSTNNDGQSQSDDDSETSESTDSAGDGAESTESKDSGQSSDDDTDDGESADSENGDSGDNGDGQDGLEYDDYSSETSTKAGSTQSSFEQGVNNLRNGSSKSYQYYTLPTMNLENCIIDYQEVSNIWDMYDNKMQGKTGSTSRQPDVYNAYQTKLQETAKICNEFLNRTKSTVAIMMQQFQMKQAADADKRTDIAKTGVLDTINMINYRWSEDIFMKNEVHADSKNHGIVMYLDWSGSMYGIIQDTIEQLIILTEFCKKVNIPFDVYAFSSKSHPSCKLKENNHQYEEHEDNSVLVPHNFALIQFLSSDMKTNEYKQAVQKLYHCGVQLANHGYAVPSEFGMGCTPLNESIMCAMQQVPAFQAKHNLQIVNTVFLTDGDGHSMGAHPGYYDDKTIVHDSKTRKDYEVASVHSGETQVYLQILQEQTGTNLIGIRLYASRAKLSSLKYRYFNNDIDMSEVMKLWRKNNFVAIDGHGYDKLFIVRGNLKVEVDALDNIGDDASYTKLKNAFIKGSNTQKTSRVIASQMIDIIAN